MAVHFMHYCSFTTRYAVRVLEVAKDVVTKLCLIRIIKSIVFAEAHLLKVRAQY